MTIDFLPQLPKPNLDDRTFNDLVEECKLRIPRYCPEWTNYNPSDPGITFIELFAWLTDQMLYRFNQVPYRLYIVFLEMLGIRLQPPAPAQTALTFYLSRAQPDAVTIPAEAEVATPRTETEPAIIFTTDRDLIIGQPQLKYLLMADTAPNQPINLQDRTPTELSQRWNLPESPLFIDCSPGNCFYLVLDEPRDVLAGNVIALTFRGRSASSTGINPDNPPLQWEAWDGRQWCQSILRERNDDYTKGFSFDQLDQPAPNPVEDGADVILHLPQTLQKTRFATNEDGYWIRCRIIDSPDSDAYSRSPEITGIAVRAIGGAVNATQCVRIQTESLGISDGKPGQVFELQGKPVLGRAADRMATRPLTSLTESTLTEINSFPDLNRLERREWIQICLPNGDTEDWIEVEDFSDSGANDRHYTIDPLQGTVQFGPLIREPGHLASRTDTRSRLQPNGRLFSQTGQYSQSPTPTLNTLSAAPDRLEHQYGRVPPMGAEIIMLSYRIGGGTQGNVEAKKLTVLKSAIPYVKSVTNYEKATNGQDAESLEQAMMRVPSLLRTRESAVIPEDFERVTYQASAAIARVHCIKGEDIPGVVQLLVVPKPSNSSTIDVQGIHPETLTINPELESIIQEHLRDRKPLGIQIKLHSPDYVGVRVRVPILLAPHHNNVTHQAEVRRQLLKALYRFLNPTIGGLHQTGWPLATPIYPSDIVAFCQNQPISGIRSLGAIELFEIRRYDQGWFRTPQPVSVIDPGPRGILCSWDNAADLQSISSTPEDSSEHSGHHIVFL